MIKSWTITCACLLTCAGFAAVARARSFGIELGNTLVPASGGMAGASIARLQDLTSGLNGNPASLTQFRGTRFTFGGAWAEPTINLTQASNIPVVGPSPIQPFSAKSSAPGAPGGNIGVTQELCELGLPLTLGTGFVTTAGGFADFRHVRESRETNSATTISSLPMSVGAELTQRHSVGASAALGIAFFNGPFVGTSSMTPDYAMRGALGANHLLTECTPASVAGYWVGFGLTWQFGRGSCCPPAVPASWSPQ